MSWPSTEPGLFAKVVSRILLGLALPLAALLLLVAFPLEVLRGLRSAFSGHDVVQVADGTTTAVTLLVLILLCGGLAWLCGLRPSERVMSGLMLYGWFMWLPVAVLLGLGAEYGLEAVLSAKGYDYCTFHITDISRGADGTYVYVRRAVPDGCAEVLSLFPPGQRVEGRTGGFNLPGR